MTIIRFATDCNEETILGMVEDWVELLAQGHYETAFGMLYHSPEEHWTPDLMRTVVANYGSVEPYEDGYTFQVTSLKDFQKARPHYNYRTVERFPNQAGHNGLVGEVRFNLPLDGEWSDLTAIFYIRQLDDTLVLELADIHVM